MDMECYRKRAGAWGLNKDHLSFERVSFEPFNFGSFARKEGGFHYSNSDPITGQAAWYDLKVHIQKAKPSNNQRSEPYFYLFLQILKKVSVILF